MKCPPDLVEPNALPGERVTFVSRLWQPVTEPLVGSRGPFETDVLGQSRSAAYGSECPEPERSLRRDDPGRPKPVDERRGREQQSHVGSDRRLHAIDGCEELCGSQRRRAGYPARNDYAPAESAPAQVAAQPLDPLFVETETRIGNGLTGCLGVSDGRVQMVCNPFEFGVQDTNEPRLWRDRVTPDAFDRFAERNRVRHRCDSLASFAEKRTVVNSHPFETQLDSTVLVERTRVEVRNVLSGGFDRILDRLEHSGTDWPVRDRENPFASQMSVEGGQVRLDRSKRAPRAGARSQGVRGEREDERVGLGVSDARQAEQVGDLAFVPCRGRDDFGERREPVSSGGENGLFGLERPSM
jgi:hypothetical protein